MCAEKSVLTDGKRQAATCENAPAARHSLWPSTTVLLVLTGLALRLFLIFPGPIDSKVEFLRNKADLRNYYWPAQAALSGQNPYVLWQNGLSGEFRSDLAPLELLVFEATVAVWNDPRAIQVLFALCDAVNIALLGLLLNRSRLRLPFQFFYAFGPLTLYNLVLVPEDKTIVITLTLALFLLLARSAVAANEEFTSAAGHVGDVTPLALRSAFHVLRVAFPASRFALLIIVLTALIASFKWLSIFYLLPLLLFVSPDFGKLFRHGLVFAFVVILAHLPWFPAWSYMYGFRLGRVVTPFHIAPSVLLNAVGLYDRALLLPFLALSLLLVYALFWLRRIDIFETVVGTMAVGILWTPDMDPVHLSLVTLFFLLVFDWSSASRQSMIWLLSAWAAFVYAVSTRSGFTRYGLPDVTALTGAYGSLQMILLSYPMFLTTVGFYLYDRWRKRPVGGSILIGERHEC